MKIKNPKQARIILGFLPLLVWLVITISMSRDLVELVVLGFLFLIYLIPCYMLWLPFIMLIPNDSSPPHHAEEMQRKIDKDREMQVLANKEREEATLPKGLCPACNSKILLSLNVCPKCKAIFDAPEAWKIKPL